MSQKSIIETVDQIINHAKEQGVIHLNTEDEKLNQNVITIDNKPLINFGSCSYLGLEFNQKVRNAAKQAIDDYGTQFSSSRAYISPRYYNELESKLEQIFDSPTIVTATTTLGHLAALPVLVGKDDAVILDHQVHSSVQSAAQQLKAKKIKVELIRHNRMDLLENRIQELKGEYDKIWYMADGIYSMYGDTTPIEEVYNLLDKYPQLNFYVDDAHAMSCYGDKGQGYVLSKRKIHERMVVATSFAKAFATGGGALIFPNRALAQKVRNCGGPLITSGPMQPSALGAANAVADLHLSGEITELQEDLQENILYANLLLKRYKLPNLSNDNSPIFFIAASLPKVAYELIKRLKADGFFLNLGIFPAVPIKNTGVRFTITQLHSFEQIASLIKSMSRHYFNILEEYNVELDSIYKAFKLQLPEKVENNVKQSINFSKLKVTHYDSIREIPKKTWDALFEERGTFNWNGLRLLEDSFVNNPEEFQNWNFTYIIIRDFDENIVLATFLTQSISKDDMFSNSEVSREIENKRKHDPMFMTSRTLSVGSPITEGNHLYIDKNSALWKEAMSILFDKISEVQEREHITTTIIRDLPNSDPEMDRLMVDNGYFKSSMPDNLKIKGLQSKNIDEFYAQLSKKNKGHYRRNIRRNIDQYELKLVNNCTYSDLKEIYQLYLNVKSKSLELNTFDLPIKLFEKISNSENWEILSLYLKPNGQDIKKKSLAAIVLCHKGKKEFSGVIAGINYNYNRSHNCYRHMLFAITRRAMELNYQDIALGYTSTIEKKHFGAKVENYCAYLQLKDNFNLEALETMSTVKNREDGINERRVLPI